MHKDHNEVVNSLLRASARSSFLFAFSGGPAGSRVGPREFNTGTSKTRLISEIHLVRSDILSRKTAVRGCCFPKDPTGICLLNIQLITAVQLIPD